ncbi:hypothetical protein BD289DRAFT_478992 [Coniella lustricola]|uniref:Transglutaminase-like domain-containing protein n=1 Tax=Coniella lustricola TaxID=2025994 RepID=A0A2T3AK95_9PEZI|nr:hypothetical protein BD289DRAFT_478992 [Coniella lustricola]
MADTEEPQHFNSLAERIAALNKQPNFVEPKKKPPPPPPPSGATRLAARHTQQPQVTVSPPLNGHAQASPSSTPPARPVKKAPPVLPQRTNTASQPCRGASPPQLPRRDSEQVKESPALPPRRASTQSLAIRRNSNESVRSTISALSLNNTLSSDGRRLPPPLEEAILPPLPPSRKEREAAQAQDKESSRAAIASKIVKAPLLPTRSTPALPTRGGPPEGRPSLPPRLPSRPAQAHGAPDASNSVPTLPARRLPPPPANFVRTIPEVTGNTAGGTLADTAVAAPPPVPLASRPSAAQIDAVSAKSTAQQDSSCLICRDFSAPDGAATQYPPSVIDRGDPIGFLAHHLCGPFSSPTDKARAIFTWCHHNIDYDVAGFFAGCPARGTASETVFSGKAVCEGYARTFEAIAKRAGLECIVVGGHGKGFGFTPVKDGQPPPPRKASGHAWNAVKIDNGFWKLIDPCWGAGHLDGHSYKRAFNTQQFTMSNEHFGWRHFPEDSRYFYRDDHRVLSWEEYVMGPTRGERAMWYGNTLEEGISEWNSSPPQKRIQVHSGETVRFQFAKLCEHWTAERNGRGKPRLLMMNIHGVNGSKDDQVPLDTDGFWWWCDIPARDLGSPGQKVQLYGLNVLNGKDAMGITKQQFLKTKSSGGYSMSWVSIAEWELV